MGRGCVACFAAGGALEEMLEVPLIWATQVEAVGCGVDDEGMCWDQ